MRFPLRIVTTLALLSAGASRVDAAESNVAAAGGRIQTSTVHAASLEQTLTGESPDRRVTIYLPPSYDRTPSQRYPVLYLLHGFGSDDQSWLARGTGQGLAEGLDRLIAARTIEELIVVMPDARNRCGGSFYSDGVASGRWEEFIAQDLVRWVDGNLRTLPQAASRGIAGHSMGGYGALRLAMRHPEVFSVVYALSPAILDWGGDLMPGESWFRAAAQISRGDPLSAIDQARQNGFLTMVLLCIGQAFSPDPSRPPFYAAMPFAYDDDGAPHPTDAFARWEAAMPVRAVRSQAEALRSLRAIRFDAGEQDEFPHIPLSVQSLSRELTVLGIPHTAELYNGNHSDRLLGPGGRIATELLPFFSRWLERQPRAVDSKP